MGLLKLAQVPPSVVEPGLTVIDAVAIMASDRVGAVAVVEDGNLRGIFTERDVMLRVVKPGRDSRVTLVQEVMTVDVQTVSEVSTRQEAVNVMLGGHLRHLPVVGRDGKLLGLLSIRALLEDCLDDLSREVRSLAQYIANDSPGS
jgi:CBS domain-containing protein